MTNVDPQDLSATDADVLNPYTNVSGHECDACRRALAYRFFERDSSYSSGHKPVCLSCQSAPRLSMEEHVAKLSAENFNSEAVKRQRHPDQEEFRKSELRWGRTMLASEFLMKLKRAVPELYVRPGGVEGDVALYLAAPGPQSKWEGRDYKYIGWVEFDTLPEHTIYLFDERNDVVAQPLHMGWRSVLLRFIKAGALTEAACDKEFGAPSAGNSAVWYKQLWNYKHQRVEEVA